MGGLKKRGRIEFSKPTLTRYGKVGITEYNTLYYDSPRAKQGSMNFYKNSIVFHSRKQLLDIKKIDKGVYEQITDKRFIFILKLVRFVLTGEIDFTSFYVDHAYQIKSIVRLSNGEGRVVLQHIIYVEDTIIELDYKIVKSLEGILFMMHSSYRGGMYHGRSDNAIENMLSNAVGFGHTLFTPAGAVFKTTLKNLKTHKVIDQIVEHLFQLIIEIVIEMSREFLTYADKYKNEKAIKKLPKDSFKKRFYEIDYKNTRRIILKNVVKKLMRIMWKKHLPRYSFTAKIEKYCADKLTTLLDEISESTDSIIFEVIFENVYASMSNQKATKKINEIAAVVIKKRINNFLTKDFF